jgi:tetratricopeptide (TPR) repeat protein
MGSLLRKQGKYDEAMPYYVEALETRRRVLGDEHPNTLNSIGNMGNLLYMQGKYEEAMPYYVEALETSRRVLGDEHSSTLWSINALIKLYDAWHEVEPDASHDAKADEYRQLLEAIEAKKAETTEPAAP